MSFDIAGSKTIDDWKTLKDKILLDFNNSALWNEAYDFFEDRMNHRYIYPAETIQNNPNAKIIGEGFSIVTILCSLIEALETFYQGKYFTPLKPKTKFEYTIGESKNLYVSFLTKRLPFKNDFSKTVAIDFYKNVRCGLLHEAATRNGWRIRIDTAVLVDTDGKEKILNRFFLLKYVKDYIKIYRTELFKSKERKEAFIRKMDSICDTA
jgi:hypothetical protein